MGEAYNWVVSICLKKHIKEENYCEHRYREFYT